MTTETYAPSSTMIELAEFDPDEQMLTVTMVNGGVYSTPNFSRDMWDDFRKAPSAGRWYRAQIMGVL